MNLDAISKWPPVVPTNCLFEKNEKDVTVKSLMKAYESWESVNESGDESGLRVDTAPPQPALQSAERDGWVAVRVNRNGRKNGGEGCEAFNPLPRQELDKKECCQV